jgi:uncharacterized RDD family membrane protein YckC
MENDYPSLSERFQSIIIDQVFIIILMFLSATILDKFDDAPDWIRIVLFFGIWGIYEPVCMTFGCTIGNFIKRIRVKKFQAPEKNINIFQAYVRYVTKVLLGFISFLTITTNKERRAIHDMAASTVMVKV